MFCCRHGSGKLMHNLYLASVYADENREGVTTFHNGWVMVDFIFFRFVLIMYILNIDLMAS